MEICTCNELKEYIEKENALFHGVDLVIYGKPSFSNDGDGHFDDTTNFYKIKYCPFCGKPKNIKYGVWITGGDEPDRWMKDGENQPWFGEIIFAEQYAKERNQIYNKQGLYYSVKIYE